MLWTEALESQFDRHARDRGQDYEALGRVSLVRAAADGAEATVRGTRLYRVYVTRGNRGVSLSCTCPRFETTPCKHVWATLLALDRGGRRGVAGPDRTLPPLPPQARPVALWQSRLEFLASRGAAAGSGRAPWPAGREVVYEVDLPATLEGRGLVVSLFHRQRRKDGTWGRLKPLKADRRLIEALPDPADGEALSWLLGGHNIDSYYSYDPYETTGSARFRLSGPLELRVLPALCATGRCVLRVAAQREPSALAWDAGGAWRFEMRVKAEADRFILDGVLRRGGDERPLDAATLVTASGLVFMDGRAALFEHDAAFAWVADLRRHHRLEVPSAEGQRLRAALLSTVRRPPVELPVELGIEEVRLAPGPRLKIATRAGRFRDESELVAEPSFQYGDAVVPAEAPGWAVAAATPPRVYVRDRDAERALVERLRVLGINRSAFQEREDGPLRLSPARLGPTVLTLTREGWHVEAEGRVYRRPGAASLRVSSGIDWFDLEASVDFEGERVSLPRLLQALRRGESTVVLDDGSLGMLPEEWLRRQAPLARFGEIEGELVRFKRSQAGLLDALLASQPEVEADAAFEKARGALRLFEGIRPLAAPRGFVGRLRGYQELGLGWMAFLREFGFGGCLADDMGLGKTVQVLALLEARRGEVERPSLVIVPRSLVFNWMEEATRFAPRLRVLDHTGLDRARDARAFGANDVVLTTYGTLRRDAALLKDVAFDYVILDEAQAIKNKATESAKAVRLLRADHRLALSGTPVENHLGELQSLFEFLNPGLLGRMPLARGGGELDEEGRAALAQGIAPFVLRRTKGQVAKDLPPKTEQTLWCDLEPEQKVLCDELREHYRSALLDRVERQGLARSKIQVLEALLRMRQAACHPGLVDPRQADGPSAKLDALVPRLVEIVEEGHKALVFSQFTSFLALLKPRLVAAGLVHEYLDGKTRDRAARVKRFETDAACGVFLISLKAGGLGLNLTAAEYVFLLDPWWNPAVEAQAVDRTHRIGQARAVFAYRLVARGTVEEKVLALQEKKRALADAIVRADEGVLRGLRREDLELLLS
jgi:superfamily II DNA or RNA helicase